MGIRKGVQERTDYNCGEEACWPHHGGGGWNSGGYHLCLSLARASFHIPREVSPASQ